MVKKIINFSAALALSLSAAALNVQATEIETNTAKLQAMNKLTGRVSVIDVPVNGEAQFGSFSIVVRACKTRPPEEAPDNFAFVDVVDKQEDGTVSNIFKGWMISSSPALNAIETEMGSIRNNPAYYTPGPEHDRLVKRMNELASRRRSLRSTPASID